MAEWLATLHAGNHICPVCGGGWEFEGVCSGQDDSHPPEMTEEHITGELVQADTVGGFIPKDGPLIFYLRENGKLMLRP